jgi:hypothetical protein
VRNYAKREGPDRQVKEPWQYALAKAAGVDANGVRDMSNSNGQSGLDDPTTRHDLPAKTKRAWYVTAPGFWTAVSIGGGWGVVFALRLVGALTSGHSSSFNNAVLVLNGLLVIAYVPSIVHFARIRRAKASG